MTSNSSEKKRDLDSLWSLPNLISLSRIPLAGLVWLGASNPWYLISLCVIAGITDILDGGMARYMAAEKEERLKAVFSLKKPVMGTWLDPLCDKIFTASVVGAIWISQSLPLLWLFLLMAREILQLLLILLYSALWGWNMTDSYDFTASYLGKGTTFFQFVAIFALIFDYPQAFYFIYAAAVIGILSIVQYAWRGIAKPSFSKDETSEK